VLMGFLKIKKKKKSDRDSNVEALAFVRDNYASYGHMTVQNRAIPDFRDGLKPVHRRIIWTAYEERMSHFSKSARLVGVVLGKYHPHGDTAVYDSLVSMVHWPTPAFVGQGNWGDPVDGSSPAAMRYCVTGDTMVHTDHGLIPIKNLDKAQSQLGPSIRKEYKTQSLNGDMMPVSNWIYSGKYRTRKIHTNAGFELSCTANHPLLVVTPEWKVRWVEAGDILPGDYVCINRSNDAIEYNSKPMKSGMAKLLGYMVSDGYCGQNDFQFSSAYKSISDDFRAVLEEIGLEKYGDYLKEPSSYGKRKHRQISITDRKLRGELEAMGLYVGTSYDRVVPHAIWSASKKDQRDFLAAYFEGDGSISIAEKNSVQIAAHSVNRKLLKQIKLLLWTHFNIMTSPIFSDGKDGGYRMFVSGVESIKRFLDDVGFVSKRKLHVMEAAQEALENISSVAGNSKIDVIPYAGDYGVHVTRRKCAEHFDNYKHLSAVEHQRLTALLASNYLFAKVTENKRGKKRKVYDLTVPKTHAFTANGFVAHNTECKLSKYSELALLDKEYLDCVPMHANYDGMETQPLYLPSLLPTLFLTGDMGVAVGVSVKYPAFTLKTLSKLITGALKSGKPVTAKQCAKALEIDKAAFGGEELYNETEYLELFKNTSSRLEFRPTHSISPKAREITVTSSAPGFNLTKSMEKFEEYPDVMGVENRSSRDGRKWVIRFKPSVAQENFKALADSLINKFLSSAVTYIQAGTKRSIEDPTTDDTKSEFFYSTTVDLLNRWLEWRLQLERDMLKRRLANQRAALHKVNIVIKAAINAVALMKEISKKAPDLDKRIAKFLSITEEDAKIVLALQLRSMANLELSTLKKQRAAIKASIKDTKARRKQPGASAAEKTGAIVSAMKL